MARRTVWDLEQFAHETKHTHFGLCGVGWTASQWLAAFLTKMNVSYLSEVGEYCINFRSIAIFSQYNGFESYQVWRQATLPARFLWMWFLPWGVTDIISGSCQNLWKEMRWFLRHPQFHEQQPAPVQLTVYSSRYMRNTGEHADGRESSTLLWCRITK